MNWHSNTKEIIIIFLVLLFAGVLRIPSLTQPIGPDQGIMAVIGEGIVHGKLPYRDYWEMASPAIFFTYALMFKMFGASMGTIPAVDMLVSILTTLLIYLLARSIWDRRVGIASALLFAFFSNGIRLGMHAGGDVAFGTFWYMSQRETFMLPLIVGGFYALLKSERGGWKPWPLFTSGLLLGLAFMYKFPAIFIVACGFGYLNWGLLSMRNRTAKRRILQRNTVLIAGFALAWIPFLLVFAVNGALREMIDVIFKYVFSIYGQIEQNFLAVIRTGFLRTEFIAKENFILWLFMFVSSIDIVRNNRRRENILMVLWGLAAGLFVAIHKEFFGYHYLVILPPLAILSGYGLIKALGPRLNIRRIVTAEWGKAFIILAVLANLAFFITLNYMHYTKSYYYLTGKITQQEYYAFFNAYPKHDYSFPADYEAAQYIALHTNPEDRIYVLGGTDSAIFFLSRRESASRFIFSWFLFSSTHGHVPKAREYRSELLADLEKTRPKYVVTIRPLDSYESFTRIHQFIAENYVLDRVLPDDRYVYVHRSS